MKIGTKLEMNKMDEIAINDYGIPSILLMEHAALGVYKVLKEVDAQKIIIVCGPGNNGGDGLALARQLVTWTKKVIKVVLVTPPEKLSQDGNVYYNICKKLNVDIARWEDIGIGIVEMLEDSDVIVDAIFGTGLTRCIEGFYKEVIDTINQVNTSEIISLDVPSGIACDDGKVMGVAIRADQTFTFQIPKIGLCLYPGIIYSGKVSIIDIGIPKEYMRQLTTKYQLLTAIDVKKLVPRRPIRSHKGDFGKVLIIGGSREMSGAITLTTKAAMKTGAGVVSVAVPECIQDRLAINCIDAMTIGISQVEGHFDQGAIAWLVKNAQSYDVIAIGPGMGRSSESSKMVETILKIDKPCVIDADGLYNMDNYLECIKERNAPVILTPHPKEFARISGYSIQQIIENPIKCTQEFVARTGAYMILKTERSIMSSDDEVWINQVGNPALAKGGSGDILTGLVTGVLAWSKCARTAMKVGCYVHGAVADKLCENRGEYSILPSEIIEGIGAVLKELEIK